MSFALNLLWIILGGWIVALGWAFGGILLGITIIGIPLAIAAFRIAGFVLWPFGRELVDARLLGEERISGTAVANFVWIILAGLWLSIAHALSGLAYCLTIIGIPLAIIHFKMASVCFAPLGKRVVDKQLAQAALQRDANARLSTRLEGTPVS